MTDLERLPLTRSANVRKNHSIQWLAERSKNHSIQWLAERSQPTPDERLLLTGLARS